MQYKEFKDGIKLSRLGMGNMRLPIVDGDYAQIDYEKAKKIVDCCIDSGINYYDTAYIYHGGQSECFLGKALSRYPRDSYYVADKFNMMANPDFKAQFAEQLERLQMDVIDFYLLHGTDDASLQSTLDSGCIAYFDEMKKQGKIRYFGFSYHGSPALLPQMLNAYPWDFVQIQLNYYDWYFGDAKPLYEMLAEANIPVLVMEPVHGGLLANLTDEAAKPLKELAPDKSLASWAMRWVIDLDNVHVVLSGMSETAQVEDNLSTFDEALPLSSEDHTRILEAAQKQHAAVAVACTSCRYCCPDCPMGLDIPFLIKSYNDAKIGGTWRLGSLMAIEKEQWPSACIGCGECMAHCPQSFDIPEIMSEMTEMMKTME
ncbi:MAG: 4Fe-4S binding protein [Clostridiales bacterium]|nr:4Fe-4S binding protein [Clostridiales bacterium]